MDEARRWVPYCGEAPGPEAWLGRWNLDPVLLAILMLLAVAIWWRPGAWPHAPLRWAWAGAVVPGSEPSYQSQAPPPAARAMTAPTSQTAPDRRR